MALNSAAGIYYSLKGLVNSCELTLKGLDDVAAKYAAKQEAWYKEHAGAVQDGCSIGMGSYTDRNTGQIVEVGACFIAGTKVQTPDGEKNIEDIQVGDRVYAHNTETGETGIKEVKNAFVREVNTLVHVFVGEEEIITTTNHPFYVVGEGFVQAGDLKVSSPLLLLDGTTEKVSRIYVEALQTPVKVYNFEVEDWHTYYVSEEACMVHNFCGVGEGGSVPNYEVTWNKSIKATQEMIEGTNIPKSFTIKGRYVNGKEVWVHGNATKHMGEYVNSANGLLLVENELMISFQDTVSQILPKVQSGRNFFYINGWEIGINGDTGVIYHALYK